MSLRRLAAGALLALALTGCAVVPLGSVLPLTRIDLETTDLMRLRAAFVLPEGLVTRPGGVTMDVTTAIAGKSETTGLVLVPVEGEQGRPGLPAPRGGYRLSTFRLADADISRFDALRRAVMSAKRAGQPASLGMGIATREFCTTGPLPERLLSWSYLATSETGGYVALTEGLDLRAQKETATALADLQPC